jgi:ATP adenylyltransferase
MEILYAPWRSEFSSKEANTKKLDSSEQECVFCLQFAEHNDEKYYILKRFKHCVVMLNRFPYNAGHLLIIPIRHTDDLADLFIEARTELMELISACTVILKQELVSQGTNIGLNLGKASGPSIPAHLHFHVLPRWQGDTNFMPALAQTKVISFDLDKIYQQLKQSMEALSC